MNIKQELKRDIKDTREYVTTFINWTFLSCFVGVAGGLVGVMFYKSIGFVTGIRLANPWLVYFLPFAGLVIAFLYRILDMKKDPGTNLLITAVVAHHQHVPQRMAFLIFTATVITHLFGGSVGRESASLQLGGCCGNGIGRLFHLNEHDRKLITMCGMSALFSAVFGTPITATVFVIEFISVGIMHYSALVPCLTAAYIAKLIAEAFHIEAEAYVIAEAVPFELISCGKVLLLGAACALAGILFCWVLHTVGHALHDHIENDYLRIFVGGTIVVLGTVLVGSNDYNGTGAAVIEHAIEGHAVWYAFLLKMIFTAVTLGAGYKGGEIVPSFFIGATMGCVVGPLLGLPASLAAGLGLVGVFCAVVNCPLASIILSVELFGSECMPFFAIICVVSYMLSGPFSLYSSQKLLYSKLRPQYINQHTM
ncbi:MAG: chloride channel protein [Oscillospiraceae bacterium]|nr:chloride channel protein [Oscillospiraceae bacterium]